MSRQPHDLFAHPASREHGFWDYTTPGAGGAEGLDREGGLALLDDMAGASMNSICLVVKWFTTGYRSRLPFLDQVSGNTVIDSDNRVLREFLAEAKKRNIRSWLGAVVNMFPVAPKMGTPTLVIPELGDVRLSRSCGVYDLDTEGVIDRGVAIMEELVDLFPGVDGLVVEVEHAGWEAPHRVPLYNAWAEANGRPRFDQILRPLQPRTVDISPWRDYTTYRRIELLGRIERAVRARGFHGELGMLCETGRQPYLLTQEVNLRELGRHRLAWAAVSYEANYDKSGNRLGMMELCIEEPRKAGLKTYYLPRGVMTWPNEVDPTIPLRDSWRLDAEDIARFEPEGVWWFGAGVSDRDGAHVSMFRLQRSGFTGGPAARRALLETIGRARDGTG